MTSSAGDAVADGKWQPDAAVMRQQQGGSEGRYTIFRQALEVTDHDLEDGRERARTEGKSIFNPDLKRFQAALAPEHDLVCRVVRKLEELGWLSDGRTPSRAYILHSKKGCAAQKPLHFDFDANAVIGAPAKPFSVLLALEDDTTLDLPGGVQLVLQRSDLLVFNGDLAHAGSAYPVKANTRFFMYVDAPHIVAPEDETFPYEGNDDEEPRWCGADLVGTTIKIGYLDDGGEGSTSTYWTVKVNSFDVHSKKHTVVGQGFQSTEDLNDCHWRYKFV
jgi:hypothetical protein